MLILPTKPSARYPLGRQQRRQRKRSGRSYAQESDQSRPRIGHQELVLYRRAYSCCFFASRATNPASHEEISGRERCDKCELVSCRAIGMLSAQASPVWLGRSEERR